MRNRKSLKALAVSLALAVSFGVSLTPVHAASTEILVWADESRGPNLTKVIAAKSDWVA